jgi:hypothetical protein
VELKALSALADEEREQVRELEHPDLYGFFSAKPPLKMTVKSAARESAELFRSLATPAPLDSHLYDEEDAAHVVDLVLDRILEIESDDGFVSGADAFSILGATVPRPGGALSREALQHAQELETDDPQTLAMALYRYNHIPITPFWKKRFAGPQAVMAYLGADRGALRSILERDWTFSEPSNAWLEWTSIIEQLASRGDQVLYKLYVSPRPERIREAFEALVRVLVVVPGSFKIGSYAAGLLRPDKLVAYFATREQLDEAATMMQRQLAGCEAHGVPFTAACDDSGLLSWGVDPPETDHVLRWLQRSSWRLWVVQRLGGALAVAKSAHTASAVEPWQFAVARIQRLGVDVGTWTPSPTLWESS